jgi:hypothetical protein
MLKVRAEQEAAESIRTPSNLAFQHVEFLRARDDLRSFLHLLQLVEEVLYLPGILAMLTG